MKKNYMERATLLFVISGLFACLAFICGGVETAFAHDGLAAAEAATRSQETSIDTLNAAMSVMWKVSATIAGICMTIAGFFVTRWILRNDNNWIEHYAWREEKADPVIRDHKLIMDGKMVIRCPDCKGG